MKRILILLTSMLLLVGCVESMALIGGGATSGKTIQTSLNSAVSYGIKKTTGKSREQKQKARANAKVTAKTEAQGKRNIQQPMHESNTKSSRQKPASRK